MNIRFNRRVFLKWTATAMGVAASKRLTLHPPTARASDADLSIVKGDDPAKMTQRALELLGGINSFVGRGDRVVILPNPQGGRPGVSTNASIAAKCIELCIRAGAESVTVASIHSPDRWQSAGLEKTVAQAGGVIHWPTSDGDWARVSVPEGRVLKEARVIRKAIENDVLINMPIAKQHDSTAMTCTLKNLMGFHAENRSFHRGTKHLHQSIVDLATLFTPRLLIIDATTVLAENGPFGPGRLISPNQLIAGTDMVAADALCCGLFGLEPEQVPHIIGAHETGMGRLDLDGLSIQKARI